MKELNLTQGSVPKVLLQFAVPFLIANVLQALYGGADLFVVGQYDDSASVAAVAIGSQVMQTITGIILGITTGTTVLIAIATGAKDDKKVAFTIGSSVWLFSIIGVLLTLVMVVFHGRIAELMHTPIEAMADTKSYILVCSAGILFIVGYNVVCGILRGLGDSKTPLYFVALACVINIVLDFILVGYFHLGATGAAVATITAQGVSFMISLWFLYRHGFHFEFTRKDIRLNRNLAKKVMTLGAPIALQDALINISFLIITVIVNQMGVIASASLGVVEKIIVFAMLPPMAISSAVATMTAQNYGAGKIDRVKKGYRASLWTIGIWGLLITLIFIFTPTPIATIFFHEPSAIATAVSYLVIIGFSEAFLCIELTTIGAISGLGKTNLCSIISILFTSARIPLAMILGNTSMGLNGIWWAFSSTTIIKGIIFTGTFFWIIKKCPKNMNTPSSQA